MAETFTGVTSQEKPLIKMLRCIIGYLVGLITPALFVFTLPLLSAWLLSFVPEELPGIISGVIQTLWIAILFVGIMGFSFSIIFNSFIMGFSPEKSSAKFLILCSQGIPMALLLWIPLAASDTSTEIPGDTVGNGLEYIVPLVVMLLTVVGAYWGMSNPIASWLKK